MLTRQECEKRVKGPGKFEGEPPWTPYYWDLTMEGGADDTEYDGDSEDAMEISVFKLGPEDFEIWPELVGSKRVFVWEDSFGFVSSSVD